MLSQSLAKVFIPPLHFVKSQHLIYAIPILCDIVDEQKVVHNGDLERK